MSWLLSMLNVYLPPVQLPLPLQDATHSGLQIDNEALGLKIHPGGNPPVLQAVRLWVGVS